MAGKRKGTADDRHLWPEMLRAIREIQPKYVVGENVPGFVNWDGGMVFEQVLSDLESEGYEVNPVIIPACAVNAPHRRDRIWIVAHRTSEGGPRQPIGTQSKQTIISRNGSNGPITDTTSQQDKRRRQGRLYTEPSGVDVERDVTNPGLFGQAQHEQQTAGLEQCDKGNVADTMCTGRIQNNEQHEASQLKYAIPSWDEFPTQSPVRFRNDGLSTDTYTNHFSNENAMDRDLVIKGAIDAGRIDVDFKKGLIYSMRQRGKEGQRILLEGSDCNGYRVHNLIYNGIKKQCRAHQIIWIAANGLYDKSFLMIDHINRNRSDNRLENLRLVDAKGNRANSTPYDGKLTQEQKDILYFLHKESNMSMKELAEDFGISKSRVQQLISEHSGLEGITFPKWRAESIKAAGNAICPQVAYQIFKSIAATL